MIAIFDTYKDADKFAKAIHKFLKKNRERYNAKKWSGEKKSANTEECMVKIPDDFYSYIDSVDESDIKIKVKKLPEGWEDNIIYD